MRDQLSKNHDHLFVLETTIIYTEINVTNSIAAERNCRGANAVMIILPRCRAAVIVSSIIIYLLLIYRIGLDS